MAAHNDFGSAGEQLAADFLQKKGYCIRHRNWRAGRNELDIVAEKNGELVVVEVKSRKDNTYGNPYEAIDGRKIRRIVSATDTYLKVFSLDLFVRFDIITVTGNDGNYNIEHIEDAFYPPLW